MRRWHSLFLMILAPVLLAGCGGKDPPLAEPLTPDEERRHEEELKRAVEEEGEGSRLPKEDPEGP